LGLLVHGCCNEWCPYWAWRNRIDADSLADVLVAESSGERDDCPLCAGVVEQIGTAYVGIDASVVDDGASALHVGDGVFREVEEGVDVGIECVEPLILRAPQCFLVPSDRPNY